MDFRDFSGNVTACFSGLCRGSGKAVSGAEERDEGSSEACGEGIIAATPEGGVVKTVFWRDEEESCAG